MKDHTFSVSRRKFLQTAATAAVAAPFKFRCSSGNSSSSNILNHACIGVGGMGWADLQKFIEHPNVKIVAICDVDADNLKKASKALPEARTYTDWRELLKRKGIKLNLSMLLYRIIVTFPSPLGLFERESTYIVKSRCVTM